MRPTPNVAFLGLAERAAFVRFGPTNLRRWNVIGLSSIIPVNFVPANLSGFSMGIALNVTDPLNTIKLIVRHESGDSLGDISITAESEPSPDPSIASGSALAHLPVKGWTPVFLPFSSDLIATKPGQHFVDLVLDDSEVTIGTFHVVVADPPALTAERIAAVRSAPFAVKAARAELGCKHCPTKLRLYTALDRLPSIEADGFTWYENLPDDFHCSCQRTRMDLRSMRRNFHALLGHKQVMNQKEISLTPLYEQSALQSILADFHRLLKQKPREELLQKFIEENLVLLHQFPAESIFLKPPILTFYKADFAIVTPKKDLILIEIENAETRLLNRSGGLAAQLQHAFDQVNSWLHVVDDHRLAVLDAMKITRDAVGAIRGVVIAGRDIGYDAEALRRLKAVERGRTTLLTFDDLAFGLAALIKQMEQL